MNYDVDFILCHKFVTCFGMKCLLHVNILLRNTVVAMHDLFLNLVKHIDEA
jgi:hypothetical protein